MTKTVNSNDAEYLMKGYAGRLLLTISVGWAFIQAGRLAISPLLPRISSDLGLSSTQAGFALTLLWGLYAVLQYPSGRLSDRLSRKTLLVGGLILLCVGFGIFAGAQTYLVLVVGALVIGLGAGLYPTPARGLVSDLFVDRRGQAFGIHTASGDIGGVVAAGLATLIIGIATWRSAFLPVIVILLLVALFLHFWSRENYVFKKVDLAITETGRRLFKEPQMRSLLLAYALYAFTWQAVAGFLPTYLQVGKGFSPTLANAGFAALFIVGVIAKSIAGWLGDLLPRELLAPGVLGIAAVMLTVLIAASSTIVAAAAVICFAAGLLAFPPVMQAHLMDSFPTASMGGDLGAMRSIYIGLGALGPTYIGAVADAIDYETAFFGLVACILLSGLIILVLGRQ